MPSRLVLATALVCLTAAGSAHVYVNMPPVKGPVLVPSAALEARTSVAMSSVPGAGNGLFAKVKIKKGEVIGELGGQLVDKGDPRKPSGYLAELPACAHQQTKPYRLLDSEQHGGHVSRINFAPRVINGKETNFQNSGIKPICESPWIVFEALRDIEPGEEIFVSYGPRYNYSFMSDAAIRAHFCGRAGVDCSQNWKWEF